MSSNKVITLGAGCFWCVQACYSQLRGVISAISGYSNGHTKNPTYKEVCSGTTNHAEVVQVEYDPKVIDTERLLNIFFFIHDPTQLNRQGEDIGTQYRSAVFYHDAEQKTLAEKLVAELDASGAYKSKIVTEIAPVSNFHPAEEYHQDYAAKNPDLPGYCQMVVRPKIAKFKNVFGDLLKQ